jgi:hypothetical protein
LVATAGKVEHRPNGIICLTCNLHTGLIIKKHVNFTDNHDFIVQPDTRQVMEVMDNL